MKPSTEVSGLSVLLFRVLLSGIFISAGITHLIQLFIINNPKVYSIYNK